MQSSGSGRWDELDAATDRRVSRRISKRNGSSAATSASFGACRSRAETISSCAGSGHSIAISGSSQAMPRSTAGS